MFLQENELVIRDAKIDDALQLSKWWNDGKVMEHAGFPNGLNTTISKVVELIKGDTIDNKRLILELDDHPIGEMSYRKLSEGVVEIGIKICQLSKQNKGYGTRYLRILITYLFNTLKYEKIVLDTNILNKRAQHVYEKLGFKKIRTNYNAWKDQLGRLQTTIDYELTFRNYQKN